MAWSSLLAVPSAFCTCRAESREVWMLSSICFLQEHNIVNQNTALSYAVRITMSLLLIICGYHIMAGNLAPRRKVCCRLLCAYFCHFFACLSACVCIMNCPSWRTGGLSKAIKIMQCALGTLYNCPDLVRCNCTGVQVRQICDAILSLLLARHNEEPDAGD